MDNQNIPNNPNSQINLQQNPIPDPNPQNPIPNLNPKKSNKKVVVILTIIFLIVIIAGGVYAYFSSKDKSTPQPTATLTHTTSDNPVFCKNVGITSMQCQNVETKEIIKYDQPKVIQNTNAVIPSPDGSKYVIRGWTDENEESEQTTVVNDKFSPILKPKSNHSIAEPSGRWIDNNSLLYYSVKDEDNDSTDNDSTTSLYSLSASDGSTKKIMDIAAGIENFYSFGDGKNIVGLRAQSNQESGSVERDLVLIDIQTKKTTPIDLGDINAEKISELSFSPSNDTFFNSDFENQGDGKEQKNWITVYGIDSIDSAPKLIELQRLNNVQVKQSYAYYAVTTKKGLFAGPQSYALSAPITMYETTENTTPLSIAVGGFGGFEFSLPKFPDLKPAENQKIVTEDFIDMPTNTPKEIKDYVSNLVSKHPDCKNGEYTTIQLEEFDGSKQFSAHVASCEIDGLAFYIQSDGQYKMVVSTQEGISCKDRDKHGISKVIIDDEECLETDEPLQEKPL